MFFFKQPQKGPFEIVKTLNESLQIVEKGGDAKKFDKAQDDVSKNLVHMKNMLYGSNDQEHAQQDVAVVQLAQELYNSNLLLTLINNLTKIEFEAKKDVALIFNNILRYVFECI